MVDAATGTVLDSRTLSSFSDGAYENLTLQGHVQLRFTRLAGPNAVLAASSTATLACCFGTIDDTRRLERGLWIDGYNVIGNASSYPSYATAIPSGQIYCTWAAQYDGPDALSRKRPRSHRPHRFLLVRRLPVLRRRESHRWTNTQVTLYALDWDSTTRAETVQVIDATSGTVLDTQSLSSFHNGTYLSWNISGHVVLRFTNIGGPNAVISGLFFGGARPRRRRRHSSPPTRRHKEAGKGSTAPTGTISSATPRVIPPTPRCPVSASSPTPGPASTSDVRGLQKAAPAQLTGSPPAGTPRPSSPSMST